MEITHLQQQVDEWIKTIGVRYFNELTNMAMLTEEVGEVARIIARRYGEQSEKESDKSKDLGRIGRCSVCNVMFGQSDRS
jgi:NTP pyrophosphatase (non-canonical NTP hydrolase)